MRQKWYLALGLAVLAALLPAAGDEAAGQVGDVDGNGTDDLIWNGLADGDGDTDYIDDALEDELAQKFAPVVYLHSTDGYRPSNVEDYLNAVELWHDEPGSRVDGDVLHVETGNLTVPKLVSQKGADPVCDDAAGRQCSGFQNGQHASCFYLRQTSIEVRYGSPPGDRATYVHVRLADPDSKHLGMVDVQYWFFYPFNGNIPNCVDQSWEHESDWEHVTVRVEPGGVGGWKIHEVYYARHGNTEGAWAYPLNSGKTPYFEVENGHPVVYSAHHSHGSYAHAGTYARPGCDDKTNAGLKWDISYNLQNIGEWKYPRPGREWIQYTGRWGVPAN